MLIPILSSVIAVVQRRLNAAVGEGVIYDLRSSLFARLQRMSLRFFTNTRVGELMSRLNNDVVGAQNAISNTITNIITNLIQTIAILAVMLTLEWRLTLVALVVLPFLALVARRLGARLRVVARRSMELNAQMNAHMNETLNIGGALLVKLFGREADEERRFRDRAAGVRDIGVRRAVLGTSLFALLGIIGALGTALAYGLGGYLVIQGAFTIGTIVAFGSYIGSLYCGPAGPGRCARSSSAPPWSPLSASSRSSICRRTSSRRRMPSRCRMCAASSSSTASASATPWTKPSSSAMSSAMDAWRTSRPCCR